MNDKTNHSNASAPCHHCAKALPDGRELLDLADAAPRLAMPLRRLQQYVREGKVQHRRRDGRYQMLWPDDFNAYIDSLLEPVR